MSFFLPYDASAKYGYYIIGVTENWFTKWEQKYANVNIVQ